MVCIVKYRKKGSNDDWKYHNDGNERRCVEYLTMLEEDYDIEYEIYSKVESGIVDGLNSLGVDY